MERSDGEEKRQRRERRHTLLDLLFEFMHKSNNTERKKTKTKIIIIRREGGKSGK